MELDALPRSGFVEDMVGFSMASRKICVEEYIGLNFG